MKSSVAAEVTRPSPASVTRVLPPLAPIEAPFEPKAPLPPPPTQPKGVSVSSLLNSPVKEMTKPWLSEPVAAAPVPPPSAHLYRPEVEEGRMRSPSNISEPISRSESQGDYYKRPAVLYNQQQPPPQQDRFFLDESPQLSIPPPTRYMSPHQNILPPVRTNSPLPQHPQYYNATSPYNPPRIPPPISDPVFAAEQYSRSPIQHRASPLPPIPRSTTERQMYYSREQPDYPPSSRYQASFREQPFFERDEREYRHGERYPPQPYDRLDVARAEREQIDHERVERERLERECVERDRVERERIERERIERERIERERIERERVERDRMERERMERERMERERMERDRMERERIERERAAERERARLAHLERERAQGDLRMTMAPRVDREREQRERMEWAQRERYGDSYSRQQQYSSFRPRSPERVVYNRDYDREREEWERFQRERLDRERERMVQDRVEWERKERSHFDRERERWRRP
jgi:hypothetical protein